MNKYNSIWRYLLGRIRIPDEVINRDEQIIMHISDTPRVIFKALDEIVGVIQPEYIVHTGDLVDNLKLEIFGGLEKVYLDRVEEIIQIVGKSKIKGYIALGNHDLDKIMSYSDNTLEITKGCHTISIGDINVAYDHYYTSDSGADFFLYGHDGYVSSHGNELNGIIAINIIFLKSNRIVTMDYPWGTYEQRMVKRKIGM
jgi:hypothetical protein